MNTTETIIRCLIATVLIICACVIFILPVFYTKKEKQVGRKCHYNLANDGETGLQIKQVKANGFESAYSNTGCNSVFIGCKCECGSTKINTTVEDKPFCFLCGKDIKVK